MYKTVDGHKANFKLHPYKPLYLNTDDRHNNVDSFNEKPCFICSPLFELYKVFRPKVNRFHILFLSVILFLLTLNVQSFLYHTFFKQKMTEDTIQKYFKAPKFRNNLRIGKLVYRHPLEENFTFGSNNQTNNLSDWSYQVLAS